MALLRARRPARGRPDLHIASMLILVSHRHRRGSSANVRGELRRHAALYREITEHFNLVSWEGAAPGVAPSSQKRGPWRPLAMGRQGRLPNKQASLRREIPQLLFHYMCFLDAELKFQWATSRKTLVQLVVARAVRAVLLAARAMVATGMAMATVAALYAGDGGAISTPGAKISQRFGREANMYRGELGNIGIMTGIYTPLHKAARYMKMVVYCMNVSSGAPRGTGET